MSNNPKLATEQQVKDVSDTFTEIINHQGKQIKALESGVIDAIEPSSPAPTKRGEYKVTKPGIYLHFKDGNGQPISVTEEDYSSGNVSFIFNGTDSRKLVVPITFDGEVKEGDTRGVSGNNTFKYIETESISKTLFTEKKYISLISGNLLDDPVRLSTPFLPLGKDIFIIETTIPDNITTIANFAVYNKDYKMIKTIRNNSIIVDPSEYAEGVFFRMCGDNRFSFKTTYKGISQLSIYSQLQNENIKKEISSKPQSNSFINNAWTEASTNNFSSVTNYGGIGGIYRIGNKSTNGVLHIAFRFRINEDVNVSNGTNKKLISFKGKKEDEYIDFFVKCIQTKQFEGGEQDNSKVNTQSPIPYFQSRFGIKSHFNKNALNVLLNERGLKYQKGSSSVNLESTKPICGEDIFSIKINAVDSDGKIIEDTTSQEAQDIYSKWKNAYIDIESDTVSIVNEELNFVKVYYISTHGLVRTLFENIYRDLNDLVVEGAKIEVRGINVTPYSDDLLSRDLLKHRYFLATQYSRLDGVRTFYDSFPAYIVMGIDNSWHTFELVTTTNKDELYYCIDGQYANIQYTNPSTTITGIKDFINNLNEIVIGEELSIQIRDLNYSFNQYNGVYCSRVLGIYDTVFFSSDLHPLVWNFFGHDLYHNNYSGGGYDLYAKLVSDGGKIPDSLFHKDRNGDGTPNIKRVSLYQPSWQFENALSLFKKAGFMPITHKQYVDYVKTGKAPHHRCYIIGFDDMPTYIYSDHNLKRIFTKYGCKPYLALELGWYVDKDSPTKSYNALDWINENKDTNERRLSLQRTLRALQNDGWGIELHGAKEGYVFRGSTYFEMRNAIDEAVMLGNYLGIETSNWCIAGNFQTPNMIKLFEHRGIEVATSTVYSTTSKAFHDNYMPRTLMPSSYQRLRFVSPLDI